MILDQEQTDKPVEQNRECRDGQVHLQKIGIRQWRHSKSRQETDYLIKGPGIIGYAHGKSDPHHRAKENWWGGGKP